MCLQWKFKHVKSMVSPTEFLLPLKEPPACMQAGFTFSGESVASLALPGHCVACPAGQPVQHAF